MERASGSCFDCMACLRDLCAWHPRITSVTHPALQDNEYKEDVLILNATLLAGPVTGESLPNIVIGRILNNVFYFQSCREGIIIFKKPGFIIQFLKTAALLTVKREIVLKRHNLIKHFLLSSTGLMAYIFFFFFFI